MITPTPAASTEAAGVGQADPFADLKWDGTDPPDRIVAYQAAVVALWGEPPAQVRCPCGSYRFRCRPEAWS